MKGRPQGMAQRASQHYALYNRRAPERCKLDQHVRFRFAGSTFTGIVTGGSWEDELAYVRTPAGDERVVQWANVLEPRRTGEPTPWELRVQQMVRRGP